MRASPAKLKSGEWGARVYSADVSKGAQITVTAKSGKSWSATVAAVLWQGADVALVATQKKGGGNGYARRRRNWPREYTDRYGNTYCGGPCHDCE